MGYLWGGNSYYTHFINDELTHRGKVISNFLRFTQLEELVTNLGREPAVMTTQPSPSSSSQPWHNTQAVTKEKLAHVGIQGWAPVLLKGSWKAAVSEQIREHRLRDNQAQWEGEESSRKSWEEGGEFGKTENIQYGWNVNCQKSEEDELWKG